jgi:hypothetical protein
MDRNKLDRIVAEELEHIPRGSAAQNAFRAVYNAYRRHDLGQDEDAPSSLAVQSATELVGRGMPGFTPELDRAFFARRLHGARVQVVWGVPIAMSA